MKSRGQRKHGLFSFWPDNRTAYFADASTPKTVIMFRHLEKTGVCRGAAHTLDYRTCLP